MPRAPLKRAIESTARLGVVRFHEPIISKLILNHRQCRCDFGSF